MATVDTESDDKAWQDYLDSVRNILKIKEIDYEPKEEKDE